MLRTPVQFGFLVQVVAIIGALSAPECLAADKAITTGCATTMPSTPKVGDKAADHVLADVEGEQVRLSDQLKAGPAVVVVLRGWPGYQCPYCTKQFGDLLTHADDFRSAGARVLVVYPGPADGLREHAREFEKNRPIPDNFRLLVDPDYAFSKAHGLRWDAAGETVYPATFVLDRGGVVRFTHVSHEHGDRAATKDVLAALASLTRDGNPPAAPADR